LLFRIQTTSLTMETATSGVTMLAKQFKAIPESNMSFDTKSFLNAFAVKIATSVVDPNLLVEGILKLLYLHMLGYSMQWAAFNVIELMASPRFRGRRIGYLAASLSFGPTTDVAILTANAFKKDFVSKLMFDSGIALNCLANMVTPDVAVSIVSDVV